jgi:hypothetical protein
MMMLAASIGHKTHHVRNLADLIKTIFWPREAQR